MNRRMKLFAGSCILSMAAAWAAPPRAIAVDLESFEFNDAAGTALAAAANSANPGNQWVEDAQMVPSDIRGGVYNIVKASSVLDSNFLQINNITSGTYYLTARFSKWFFEESIFDAANQEEFRLAFLNDDDANFGSTITAQFTIRRDTATTALISADALGVGATVVPNIAPLAINQTQPFTAVIELNKTSNTYKVFYKDGTNPTQVLGMGAVAPTRGGNSVRMAANNDFGAFNFNYPADPPWEVMAVDRVALSDTNPLADLITLEINRTNGATTLRNTSGATLSGIESYSITSAAGSLNPSGWAPGSATPTTSTNEELAATFGSPINLTNGQSLLLSMAPGMWLKSPFEDVHMVLNLAGGLTRTVNVNFIQNGGLKFPMGDLDFDNALDPDDWLTFIANAETDMAGLSRVLRYQRGDLNGDGFNNIADFIDFKTAYDVFNGAGAFDAMLATMNVPEPGSAALFAAGAALFFAFGRRRGRSQSDTAIRNSCTIATRSCTLTPVHIMPFINHPMRLVCIALALAATSPAAHAVILQDFPFSDPNDTPLDNAENVASPGNYWVLSGNSWDPSETLNGNFRISKSSAMLANAHIDIANITSGKAWLVAEIAGWSFTATPSATSEQVRFAFLDNDNSPPSGSVITAQMDIRRSPTALQLVGIGALGTGATDIAGSYALPLVRTTPFTMVLELDKDVDQYSVYYKDDAAPFALLGTGELGTSTLNPGDRDGNSVRFAATGQFDDTGEFFDINRIYLTDTSPLGGPVQPVALTLQVRSDGQVSILNDTPSPITFNAYRISSPTNDLNFDGWDSLSDRDIDSIGPGVGESWDEAGGSDDGVLSERFLLGATTIAPDDSVSLGNAFKVGGAHNLLAFQYLDVTTGAIAVGSIDFQMAGLNGDYNGDGFVNAADYVLWRKNPANHGGTPGGYNTWRQNFGSSSGGGSGSAAAGVPEPTTFGLFALVTLALAIVRRAKPPAAA